MKKKIAAALFVMLACLFVGCGADYSERVAGKSFVYEKDGFYGEFKIEICDDGTFSYYEGMASSYIGVGKWKIADDAVILTDDMRTNVFEIGEGKLIWREEGSDNFIYVTVKDGEAFNET